jgi:hypothetical protein
MYDPQAIEAMTAPEWARLADRLSEAEVKSALTYLSGYDPQAMAQALNFAKSGGVAALVRAAGLAGRPEPVITDSERTCPHANNGEPCTRSGDHGVHRDANGDEWRTDDAWRLTPKGEQAADEALSAVTS